MDQSFSDTSCSSLLGIDETIKQERVRYIRKGYGLIFAILLALGFFIFGPIIMKYIFQSIDHMSPVMQVNVLLIPAHTLTYVVANLMMCAIYKLKHPFFERYKILDKPWPWEKDQAKWNQKLKHVIKISAINAGIGAFLNILQSLIFPIFLRTDLESLPGAWETIWQIAFCMFCEDTAFYWIHRLMHHPSIYPMIHKKHHEFYNTVSLSAEYAHPFEFVVSNLTPTVLGIHLLKGRMHLSTAGLWIFMRTLETVDGHCGYEFSWSPYRLLPFSGSSEYHNFHHSANIGNYGSFFSYWDTLCGTNTSYFRFRATKQTEYNLQKMRNAFEKNKVKETKAD